MNKTVYKVLTYYKSSNTASSKFVFYETIGNALLDCYAKVNGDSDILWIELHKVMDQEKFFDSKTKRIARLYTQESL